MPSYILFTYNDKSVNVPIPEPIKKMNWNSILDTKLIRKYSYDWPMPIMAYDLNIPEDILYKRLVKLGYSTFNRKSGIYSKTPLCEEFKLDRTKKLKGDTKEAYEKKANQKVKDEIKEINRIVNYLEAVDKVKVIEAIDPKTLSFQTILNAAFDIWESPISHDQVKELLKRLDRVNLQRYRLYHPGIITPPPFLRGFQRPNFSLDALLWSQYQ